MAKKAPTGRLELTWTGKDQALIPTEHGKYGYTWVDPTDVRVTEVKPIDVVGTVGDVEGPNGADQNLLIVGDSGDALRSLGTVPEYEKRYRGQVKCVYIDPPFNTGQTFANYEDGLEHSIWLTMMRDRIRDIKPLLAAEASIWVHLDDVENHRMRLLLDEEFGPENFVAEFVWQKADSPRSDTKGASVDHDVILCYRNNPETVIKRMPRTAADNARFSSPDGDSMIWFSGDRTAPGDMSKTRQHPGVYSIEHPLTGELVYPAVGRHWSFGQDRLLESLSQFAPYVPAAPDITERSTRTGLVVDKLRADVKDLVIDPSADRAEVERRVRDRMVAGAWPEFFVTENSFGRKAYPPDQGQPARTWWSNDEVGHNRTAKSEIKVLFPGRVAFATPKPEALLERIIHIATDPGDLVLDCFAGSGTTAAVAHKMGRRWIVVELKQDTADTFIIPRLNRVVDGSDQGGISTKTERVTAEGVDLAGDTTPVQAAKFNTILSRVAKHLTAEGTELDPETLKALRVATKTREEKTVRWSGGGGFTIARMGPSMYEVDEAGTPYLSEHAVNGTYSKAVAGQLGFSVFESHPVFIGYKGRQRLSVIDGVLDIEVVPAILGHLADSEHAVIVAKGVLPEARQLLSELSPGSKIRKTPTDLFAATTGVIR